jgi:hypothetical protein
MERALGRRHSRIGGFESFGRDKALRLLHHESMADILLDYRRGATERSIGAGHRNGPKNWQFQRNESTNIYVDTRPR